MNILDENIPISQRNLLRRWRLRTRQIGDDLGHAGIADQDILRLLVQLRRPTFFTRDQGFYQRQLCHQRYCLVYLAVESGEAAFFIRRLLRHPAHRRQAQRMGKVIRVSARGLAVWRVHEPIEAMQPWGHE